LKSTRLWKQRETTSSFWAQLLTGKS
jgi:hypothetical protein